MSEPRHRVSPKGPQEILSVEGLSMCQLLACCRTSASDGGSGFFTKVCCPELSDCFQGMHVIQIPTPPYRDWYTLSIRHERQWASPAAKNRSTWQFYQVYDICLHSTCFVWLSGFAILNVFKMIMRQIVSLAFLSLDYLDFSLLGELITSSMLLLTV